MSTATIERTTVQAPAEAKPLTVAEQNALVSLVASTEKTPRVKGGAGRSVRESRAWSYKGEVD